MTVNSDHLHAKPPPASDPEERKISLCTCGTEFAYGPEKANTYVTCFSCGEKVALNEELNAVDREIRDYRQEDKERADMGCGLHLAFEVLGFFVLAWLGSIWVAIIVLVFSKYFAIAFLGSRSAVPAELEKKQRKLRATMRK